MDQTVLISIIVPVYKVEAYIRRCVDSILEQTYQNLEIILVDDGSPDNSGQICDEYAKADSRVRVIHKSNGGLSDARNAGIQIAKGEYLGFIDSDDYIEPNMFELLLHDALEHDADIAICGYYDVYEKARPHYQYLEQEVMNAEEALKTCLMTTKTGVMACNKLYKRFLFDKVAYPKGKTTEDAFVIADLMEQCKTVSLNTKPLYYYVHRPESITTKKFSKTDFNVIYAYRHVVEKVSKSFPAVRSLAEARLLWAYLIVLDKSILTDETEVNKKLQRYIRKNIATVLHPFFTRNRQISALAACVSLPAYKQLVLHHRRK